MLPPLTLTPYRLPGAHASPAARRALFGPHLQGPVLGTPGPPGSPRPPAHQGGRGAPADGTARSSNAHPLKRCFSPRLSSLPLPLSLPPSPSPLQPPVPPSSCRRFCGSRQRSGRSRGGSSTVSRRRAGAGPGSSRAAFVPSAPPGPRLPQGLAPSLARPLPDLRPSPAAAEVVAAAAAAACRPWPRWSRPRALQPSSAARRATCLPLRSSPAASSGPPLPR